MNTPKKTFNLTEYLYDPSKSSVQKLTFTTVWILFAVIGICATGIMLVAFWKLIEAIILGSFWIIQWAWGLF